MANAPGNPSPSSPPPPYAGAAGGWGAVASTTRHVLHGGAPVGTVQALLRMNQPDGFDCPGCAWPEGKHVHAMEFCENGAKALAHEATSRRAGRDFFAAHPVTELLTHDDRWLEDQGRLVEPLAYNASSDRYEPVTWDAAFAAIGAMLRTLASPDEAVLYTSGRTSNEAAFLYQLFGRLLGTNNFPDCSNMCHESSGVAMNEQVGVGKGTVSLDDFKLADAIFILGQNPGSNHPRMLATLQGAVARGCRVVVVNPLRERGLDAFIHPQQPVPMLTGNASKLNHLTLQPLVGGDLAVLKGLAKLVLAAEDARPGQVLDHAFIKEHTQGFAAFAADLRATAWADIERQSGLTQAQLQAAATIYLNAKNVIACWAMGLTQHKHAVVTIQYVLNLLMLRGHLGRPGAGACPVRGHSNVQGDRTMGINEKPPAAFLARLGEVFHFTPPPHHGYDTVSAIQAFAAGRARVFIGLGGNFVRATPDSTYTETALARAELSVHIATKLNRSHLIHGPQAFLLPCLARSELDLQDTGLQAVTVEDSMSMVHLSRGRRSPPTPAPGVSGTLLLSEPAIVAGLAQAALRPGAGGVNWAELVANYDRIRDLIATVLPPFHDFNARVRQPGGFYLGNSARERTWRTASGKADFCTAPLADLTLPPGQLRLMTIRSHDQYNTTIYTDDDRYRGIYGGRRVVFLHPADLAARGLREGQLVDLTSHWHDGRPRVATRFRVVPYDIPHGCAAAYFPETNILVPVDSLADKSNCPTSKFIAITVAPSAEP